MMSLLGHPVELGLWESGGLGKGTREEERAGAEEDAYTIVSRGTGYRKSCGRRLSRLEDERL
jgi:hypothetical protein